MTTAELSKLFLLGKGPDGAELPAADAMVPGGCGHYERTRDGQLRFRRGRAKSRGERAWGKKLKSIAMGVQPSQIAAAQAADRRNGLDVKYDAKGIAHYESRSQRRRHMKQVGLGDLDGGYGDG